MDPRLKKNPVRFDIQKSEYLEYLKEYPEVRNIQKDLVL